MSERGYTVEYTAISINVVPKTQGKVEYERERLIGKDYTHYHSQIFH